MPLQFRYIPYITEEVYFLRYNMRNLPYLESPDGMCIHSRSTSIAVMQNCRYEIIVYCRVKHGMTFTKGQKSGFSKWSVGTYINFFPLHCSDRNCLICVLPMHNNHTLKYILTLLIQWSYNMSPMYRFAGVVVGVGLEGLLPK